MKRLRDRPRTAGDGGPSAALQLTLPLFELPPQPARTPDPDVPAALLPPGRPAPGPAQPPAPTPGADAPRVTPSGATRGRRIARLGEHHVEYELRRSRRRTIGFYVDDTGLRVTAPRWVTLGEIDAALIGKQRWILRKLVEWRDHAQRRERLAVRWEDGGTVAYLGRSLTMSVGTGAPRASVSLDVQDVLRIALPGSTGPEGLRESVVGWLQARAREVFAERLPIYAERLGRAPSRWRLSSARTRWGSCAPDGSIRLNWRLVHFPIDVVDYVIAHELAHLREMNHGPRFWSTVAALMPGFEAARRQLKDYPDDLALS
jgi:predicted metal-dependent hydrolase